MFEKRNERIERWNEQIAGNESAPQQKRVSDSKLFEMMSINPRARA